MRVGGLYNQFPWPHKVVVSPTCRAVKYATALYYKSSWTLKPSFSTLQKSWVRNSAVLWEHVGLGTDFSEPAEQLSLRQHCIIRADGPYNQFLRSNKAVVCPTRRVVVSPTCRAVVSLICRAVECNSVIPWEQLGFATDFPDPTEQLSLRQHWIVRVGGLSDQFFQSRKVVVSWTRREVVFSICRAVECVTALYHKNSWALQPISLTLQNSCISNSQNSCFSNPQSSCFLNLQSSWMCDSVLPREQIGLATCFLDPAEQLNLWALYCETMWALWPISPTL